MTRVVHPDLAKRIVQTVLDVLRAGITAAFLLIAVCATAQEPSGLVIRDVTVISPERQAPLEHAYVRVVDGQISDVSSRRLRGHEEIEGTGRYLIPGLIDSHVHLNVPAGMEYDQMLELPELAAVARQQEPRSYLYFGFTTIVDLFGVEERIQRWNALDVRPDAHYCAGVPIANGFPMNLTPPEFRFTVAAYQYFLYDERQADRIPDSVGPAAQTPEAVAARIAESDAVCIKAHYEPGNAVAGRDLPTMTLDMMRSLVAAAHSHGLPIIVHASTREAQAFAVAAAPDVITHTISDAVANLNNKATLDDDVIEILDGIIAADITVQPTLQPFYAALTMFDPAYLDDSLVADTVPPELVAWFKTDAGGRSRTRMLAGFGGSVPPLFALTRHQNYERAVRYLADNGARFVFGSDTPANASYGNLHGLSSRFEMSRLVAAGVTEAQLFRALTIENARLLHLDDEIGTIEDGKTANLVLLGANPLESVEAYDAIEWVFLHGRAIERESLSARAPR